MRLLERRLAVDPAVTLQFGERAALGDAQHLVDQLPRRHSEARMRGPDALGRLAHHLVIVTALAGRLDQLGSEDEVLVATAAINVVVLGNARGQVRLHARLFDGVQRGVLIAESIWPNSAYADGCGINSLTGADSVAPYGGAAFHDNKVWVRRAP